MMEQLTGLDPANTSWQRDLAAAYNQIGTVAEERGDIAAARHAFAQDRAVAERLVQLDPVNVGWQEDLSITCTQLGDLAQQHGDFEAAQHAYEQVLGIAQGLAQRCMPAPRP
jgi:Flp pilus assembly protein TadD